MRAPGLRKLRRLALGEAGAGPALALAAVAVLGVFVATAGPRELTRAQTAALHTALAGLPTLDRGITATAQWQGQTNIGQVLTPKLAGQQAASIGALIRPPVDSPPGQRWISATTPFVSDQNAPQQAILTAAPIIEVAYRSNLTGYSRLLSGSLPDSSTLSRAGHGSKQRQATFQIAVTPPMAKLFKLRLGSVIDLGAFLAADPVLRLKVSAIIKPVQTGTAFWATDPAFAKPVLPVPGSPHPIWSAGVFIGRGELTALQQAMTGAGMNGEWYFGLDFRHVTPAVYPHLITAVNNVALAPVGSHSPAANIFTSPLEIATGITNGLATFTAQQQAAGAIDSLLIVDELLAGLILMLGCARLAADAYRSELILIRARGGSTAQVARRMLARTCCVAGPGVAVGLLLAYLAVPHSTGSWIPAILAVAAALAGPMLIAAWMHRRARPDGGGRLDLATRRSPRRRLTAEVTVLVVAAAALFALREQGLAAGSNLYVNAAPVLVAAAAGLIAARLYPLPVRGMLAVASGRPGPVGFLGLARAARSRLGTILPALTLVISLTLAVFATMIVGTVTSSQNDAAWRQVGGNAKVFIAGRGRITPAAQRAIGAIHGVTSTAALYTAAANTALAAQLTVAGRTDRSVGLLVTDPPPYAALARHTPWPVFPAGLLSRRPGAQPVVPVLASDQLTRTTGGTGGLNLGNIRLPVKVVGTIGQTPGMPNGGRYVVLPAWAAPRLPSIPALDTLLVTGSSIDLPVLRSAVRRLVPGGQLTTRTQVIQSLATSPGQTVAERLCRLAAAVAVLFSAIAVLFALAASAASRAELSARLTALGMASRQNRALVLTEVLPLLSVALLGTLIAGVVLAVVAGPVLNLAVFTSSAGQVPVRPDLAMLLPAVGIALLAIVIVAAQSTALLRRDVAAMLRKEEST